MLFLQSFNPRFEFAFWPSQRPDDALTSIRKGPHPNNSHQENDSEHISNTGLTHPLLLPIPGIQLLCGFFVVLAPLRAFHAVAVRAMEMLFGASAEHTAPTTL